MVLYANFCWRTVFGVLIVGCLSTLCLAADTDKDYFALIVGVGKYPPTRFRNLPGAEPDADELSRVLVARGFRKENVTLLTNTRGASEDPRFSPTAENIRREIDLLLDNRQKSDVVVIAMAGHGLQLKGQPYVFCPFDADLAKSQSLISIDELYEHLKKCKAEFKLLLVDACREETLAPSARNNMSPESLPSVTRPSIPDPPGGVAAFFSCTKGQLARERTDNAPDGKPVSHGLFFHAVIRGLSGEAADRNGELTLPDLEKFVKRDVESYARVTYSAKQFPELLNQTRGLPALVPSGIPKEYVSKSTGMRFALIPTGTFAMGSAPSEQDRSGVEALHTVRITKAFCLGLYEVTQGEYERVTGTNPAHFSRTGNGSEVVNGKNTNRFPIESVSWFDAVEFATKLSVQDGLPAYYNMTNVVRKDGSIQSATVTISGGEGYRLPTEAEWEYACRSGTATAFQFGAMSNGSESNVDGRTPYGTTKKGPYLERTTTVGSYSKNSFNLFDMHGNVWEWCEDVYDAQAYRRRPEVTVDPLQISGTETRVLRSGSWFNEPQLTRSANRSWDSPDTRNAYTGFRLARTP